MLVVKPQAPLPFTVVVPIWIAPSNTVTVLFAAALPVRVSVVSLVIPSPTVPLSDENEAITGALGATVSTVTTWEVTPDRSCPRWSPSP